MYPTAMRCSACGISYPPGILRCLVPDCQEQLWPQSVDGPDEDWQNRVAERAGVPIFYSAVHPPNGRCEVRVFRGHLFTRHDDLLGLGYSALESGSVIRINECFYELAGYSSSTGYWLIEEIVTEGAAEDLQPYMFGYTGGADGPS